MDKLDFVLFRLKKYINHPVIGSSKYGERLCDENIMSASDKGKIYVEDFSANEFSEKFTRAISIIALIISILSLLISFFKT